MKNDFRIESDRLRLESVMTVTLMNISFCARQKTSGLSLASNLFRFARNLKGSNSLKHQRFRALQ